MFEDAHEGRNWLFYIQDISISAKRFWPIPMEWTKRHSSLTT